MLNINVDNFTELEYTNLFEITTTTTGLRFNVLDQNSNYCYTEVFYYDYLANPYQASLTSYTRPVRGFSYYTPFY